MNIAEGQQPESKAPESKTNRKYIDYDALYERLKAGPITFSEIMKFCGVSKSAALQVITTISIRYPVWSPRRGVYKLCEASDYAMPQTNMSDDDDE